MSTDTDNLISSHTIFTLILFSSDKSRYDKVGESYLDLSGLVWSSDIVKISEFYFTKNAMTKKGLITLVVSIVVYMFTPAGLHVYTVPFLVGCIGGKKVWKFYFRFFFGDE